MDDTEQIIKLLNNLPWATLLTIASGYAGYFVANVGVREHHKTVDITFSTLVFGFLAAMVYEILLRNIPSVDILIRSVSAFFAAMVFGGLWNRWGRGLLYRILRKTKVSHTDETPSAWHSLFRERDVAATQLAVKLIDGTWLINNGLNKFKHQPNGACVLGGSGDLLMYVTHKQKGTEDLVENPGVSAGDWGSEMTYVPKEQIALIEIRRKFA